MNLKYLLGLAVAATMAGAGTVSAENVITWETLGNQFIPESGNKYVQRFVVDADVPFERMAFCAFKRSLTPLNPSDTVIELLPGYYAVASPRFAKAKKGEPITVDLLTDGSFTNRSFAPDGMHLVAGGRSIRVRNIRKSISSSREMYAIPSADGIVRDNMIYGPQAFAINDSLRSAFRPSAYMQIPTPKSVTLTGKRCAAPEPGRVKVKQISDNRNDYYRVEISGPEMTVYTNAMPEPIVASVMRRIESEKGPDGTVPAAVIEDWADYPYRGMMIDVARNFTSADDMKKIISIMSEYGLNVLHFHVGDDEGWRVEIPELPELTLVGSRRGYTETDDVPFLKQIYSGDGNPDAADTPANGFYTVDEYIDLLRFAHSHGIDIIPEFDSPGHSRAAIRAMEYRYRTTGDDSFRLIHDGDTSRYTTAQDFHDNLMNPAVEGPYRFWDTVIGSLVKTYAKAGVPLRGIHIGGDEVPVHAWDGSDRANSLKAEKGISDQRELHALFVERVSDIASRHGVKIAGWQEIALDHTDSYDRNVKPNVAAVNCWTNAGDKGRQIAENGYPLVLSNVDYLYFDQTPTKHPEEPGLTWGGIVDEFQPLHATVDLLCDAPADVQANVAGISGHLFAETVRSRAMIERYLLPRILGLAERAHNSHTTLSDSEYFGTLTAEMGKWADAGTNFYLRQPGIIAKDGKIVMNDAYGQGEIRYTLDGSDPTPASKLYTAPFAPGDATQVRARLFLGPASSVTSILHIE